MNNASSRSHAIFTIKFTQVWFAFNKTHRTFKLLIKAELPGGWGSLGILGWECAAGTLEPFAYTRTISAELPNPPTPPPPIPSYSSL